MLSSNSIFGSLLKCIFFRLQFPISTESRRLEVHYRLAHSEGRNQKKVLKFNVKSKYCFYVKSKYCFFLRENTCREKHFGCLILIFISLFYRHYFSIFEAVLPVLMPCHHQLRLLWNWVQYSLCISTLIGKIKFEITFFRKTKIGVLFLDKTWICKKILQIILWDILYLVRLFSKSSPCSEFAISSFVIGSSYT